MSGTEGRRASGSAGPGGTSRRRAAAVPLAGALVGAGLLALGAEDGDLDRAYLDGPPPGHTGGFDEPTCRACHFDRPLDPEGGDVRLEGVPERWAADSVYDVRVVLTHGEMGRAGFQLAARWRTGGREGCSAGELRPGQEGVRAVTGDADASPRDSTPSRSPGDGADGEAAAAGADGGCEVAYLQHTGEGTRPVEDGVARWRIRWHAPARGAEGGGPVAFHVAANAANDDASEFGDRIYASRAVSRPPE